MDGFDSIVREACRWDTAAWFEAFGKIRRKGGELISPRANVYQMRINAAIKAAHDVGRPCRLVCLKPRQKGSSTFSVAALYRRLQAKPARGLIAGGAHFQGSNLFKILRTYADNDGLDPKSCKVMDMEARFLNGSEMERITLANANAGRSGTYQAVCITEIAYLADEGVANADEVLNGLLKCVPYEADTLIIEESTAKGASGFFYDRWQASITLEEFLAGKNGYVRIFAAWFEFDDSRLDPAGEGLASRDDLTERELDLVDRWGLDLEQVAWMRWALREECKGDWDRFCQDYPFDPESAFLKSGRGVFDAKGMEYQRKVGAERERKFGYLSWNERTDVVTWVVTAEEQARWVLWERPRVGCRYLVVVDSASGEDQTGGENADSHAVFVMRAGYLQSNGSWVEPAVVAANMLVPGSKPGSMVCWWANDVLTEEVWRAARYWQAVVVPEENHDRGLIELLKMRGDVSIYARRSWNRREQKETKMLGWRTDVRTRPAILEGLAGAVRKAGYGEVGEGLEVRCPWAIDEMRTFVVKASGKMEADGGKHDDRVMALAIGLHCIDEATPYVESVREDWLPPDLRPRGVVRGAVRGGFH